MSEHNSYIIGLDYGSESARGVLIDVASGTCVQEATRNYPHGTLIEALPGGRELGRAWALQNARDYTAVAAEILSELGRERRIESIGVAFTASSPLPVDSEGRPLSERYPDEPHAYVKLWKHQAAQPYADEINQTNDASFDNFGGRLSAEWLLPKALQLSREAPEIWNLTHRFIEAGDWLVWQLAGSEARSMDFAAYKAQFSSDNGYPAHLVPGLAEKLSPPLRIGSAAGNLSEPWKTLTGITGPATVAVAIVDSHAILPAVGGVSAGTLVGVLGTSAVYMGLSKEFRPLPPGLEGTAFDAALRDLWCCEAGQASFGDTLAWFVKRLANDDDEQSAFARLNARAKKLEPADYNLVALDWWNGNRVPFADSLLTGLLVGLNRLTTDIHIYRALMDSLCFGCRTVLDLFESSGFAIDRIVIASGLARNNPTLVQIMANVLGRPVEVPSVDNATALGAAIHGAVAGGVVTTFQQGAEKFGASEFRRYEPDLRTHGDYAKFYQVYKKFSSSEETREAMRLLSAN